jgi:hypothetical protein
MLGEGKCPKNFFGWEKIMVTKVQFVRVFLMAVLVLSLCGVAFAGSINTPIAHWTFDETSGTTAHDSAGTNNGSVSGAVWKAGKIGGALDFDGVNDYVDCGQNAYVQGNQITLSAWIKSEVSGTDNQMHRIITRWGGTASTDAFNLSYDGRTGNKSFYFELNADHSSYVGFNQPIVTDQWYFVTGVYDGTNMKIYINGEEKASMLNSGNIFPAIGSTLIGKDEANWNPCFNGVIDDVRIYDYALNAGEVSQLYQIPEPTTMILLGAGIFGLLRRK